MSLAGESSRKSVVSVLLGGVRVFRPAFLVALLGAPLLAMVAACQGPPEGYVPQSPVAFLSGGGGEGFQRVLAPRAFDLPLDHGPHDDHQIEWWYFTGNLETGNLETEEQRGFGFELTFFRIGLQAPVGNNGAAREERESRWATRQLYMTHFAVTDFEGEAFHAFERLTRGGLQLAGAESLPLRVWNEDWLLETRAPEGSPDPFPMTIRAVDQVEGLGPVGIDLELLPLKPLVLQGDSGFSPKGPEPGNASYYLQYPRLSALGTVSLGEARFKVSGLAWMDHEWSTSVLGQDLKGWDWFALQLDDGRDLMLYQLRGVEGLATVASKGTVVSPEGDVAHFSMEDFDLRVTRQWKSPLSGATYPGAWRLKIPTQGLDLTITPIIEDQELRLTTSYWEGAVVVEEFATEGQKANRASGLRGRGYVELVGYVDSE